MERVRAGEIEVYVPPSSAPPPVVLYIHGPIPRESVRPPHWALYDGYRRLAAARGLAAATIDLDYVDVANISGPSSQLDQQVADVRARPEIDGTRVALWAFSGGGLLINLEHRLEQVHDEALLQVDVRAWRQHARS
jgi:acetyl esterase/lipase